MVPCGHQEVHPDNEQDDGHRTARKIKAEKRLFNEAHTRLCAGEPGFGGDNQRQHRIDSGKNELADELTAHRQAFILLLADFGKIVDESQHAHGQHGEQHQHRRP